MAKPLDPVTSNPEGLQRRKNARTGTCKVQLYISHEVQERLGRFSHSLQFQVFGG
jgi:hypothetical protein